MGKTGGSEESHDLESLSKRTCLSSGILAQLLEEGHLEPSSAVSRHTPSSAVRFSGRDLDSLRFHALSEVVATAINTLDGDGVVDAGQRLAVIKSELRDHVSQFSRRARTVELSARDDEDGPDALKTIGAGTVATGAVAAGLWARGRWAQKVNGVAPRVGGQFVPKTPWSTVRQGAGLAVGDASRAASAIGKFGKKAVGAFRAT